MSKNHIRYYELDLLRFIAAMAVVLFHFLFRGQNGDYMPVSFQPLDAYAQYGYLGVNLFFMISGFVILLSASNRNAWQFSNSRIARLYPAFWICVSLTALVIFLFGKELFSVSLSQYLVNLTMLGEFLGVEDVDGVYWTLYVELKFYALVFLVLLFNKIHQIEMMLSTWILLILINFITPLPEIISFIVFPEWAPYFIGGASFYLIKVKGVSTLRLANLFVAFGFSLYEGAASVQELNAIYHAQASPMVAVASICFFYIVFILIIFNKLAWFRTKNAVKIGALTYPLYLLHQNIGYIAFQHYYDSVNKYLLLVLVVSGLLFVSWLVSTKIESKLGPLIKQSLDKLLNRLTNKTLVTVR